MATITDPEATRILEQLANVETQLSNKAQLQGVRDDQQSLRDEVASMVSDVTALNNRLINAQATLNDLETRVRTLESA